MVAHDDKFRVLRKLPEVRFEEELRGYSKSQVDRVLQGLAPLADDVAALQQRLAETEARAAAAEARLVEARAASRPAPQAAAPAPVVTAATPPSFDETLSKTLLLAQRTADQTVAEAKVEAEGLVGAARAEAEQLSAENARARREAASSVAEERQALLAAAHADVQAKVDAAEASLAKTEGAQRAALVAEIADYTTLRDELGEDIERLEGHLAQRREVIRAALADIAAVVDDPARLHSEMPPVAGDPIVVPAAGSGAVVLAVEGLDDLAPDALAGADDHPAPAAADVAPTDATSSASLLGELGGSVGEPTEAVPMVQLLDTDEPGDDHMVATGDTPAVDIDTAEGFLIDADESASETSDHRSTATPDDRTEPVVDAPDDADLDLDDWGTSSSSLASGAVIVDEVRWDDAPVSSASPADFGFEDAADHLPSPSTRNDEASDELGRPAWAESVPDLDPPKVLTKSEDPFLDELRRATGDDAETDVALERFLTDNPDDDDDRRSGWFSRRK